jgi:hypothetical protein
MATTNANPLFRLRRQEDIVASIINYVSGHTPRINDFNEGSIIRSLIEGVGQEIFRQNVVFAQDVADSIKESIRQAFGLPLLGATKAYGVVRFMRKMLDAPTSVTPALISSTDGHLATTSLGYYDSTTTYKHALETYVYTKSGNQNVGTIIGRATISSTNNIYYGYLRITGNPLSSSGNLTKYNVEEGMKVEAYSGGTAIGNTVAGYCGANAFVKDVVHSDDTQLVLLIQSTSLPVLGTTDEYRFSQKALTANKTYYYSVCPVFCGRGLVVKHTTNGAFTITSGANGGYSDGDTVAVLGGTSVTTLVLTVNSTTKLVTAATVQGSVGSGLSNNTDYETYNQSFHTTGVGSNTISQSLSSAETTFTVKFDALTVDGASKYIVFRATNPYFIDAVSWEVSNPYWEISPTKISISDSGYQTTKNLPYPGNKWSWAVIANNSTGSSLAGYGSISANTVSRTSAQITWDEVTSIDTESAITSYSIYRTSLGLDKEIPSSVSVTPTYTGNGVNGLTIGQEYWYSVSAIFSDNSESVGSEPIQYIPEVYYVYAKIGWLPIPDAVGYRIYRSNSSTMSSVKFVDIYNVGQEAYTDTGSLFANDAYRWTNLASVGTVTAQSTVNGQLQWAATDTGEGGTFNLGGYQNTTTVFTKTLPMFSTAQSISGQLTIGAGTRVRVPGTSKYYEVPYQKVMVSSSNEEAVMVQARDFGQSYNTEYNTITELVDKIFGIEAVYNDDSIENGQDVETEEEWRIRFTKTVQSLSRGTMSSIEAGALTAKIYDANGFVTESVEKVLLQEASASTLRLTIHNGKKYTTSQLLVAECKKIIDGYTDNDGIVQPGYKPAGVAVSVYPASFQKQNLYVTVSSLSNFSTQYIRSAIQDTIEKYFESLDISDGFVPASALAYPNQIGTTEYSYRIVCVDSTGGKSLPSEPVLIPNGYVTPNNTISWSYLAMDGAPTVQSYDILRWDPTYDAWRLVANVSGSTMQYTDISTNLSDYAFSIPRRKVFQRSELTQAMMSISGVSSVNIYLDVKSKYISLSLRRGTGLTVNTTVSSNAGTISALGIYAAGVNYSVGDVVQISGGTSPAYAMVSGVVAASGAVISLNIMDGGFGYESGNTNVSVSWPIPNEPSIIVPTAGYVLIPGIVSVQ